jgi:hypothetical protein
MKITPILRQLIAAFVILPYLIVRMIFLPADLRGLVDQLEGLVSQHGSDPPTPSERTLLK